MRKAPRQNGILNRLFFRLLPVQVLLAAMASINSIIDGAVAGRFISPETVGVIGLFYSMVNLLTAVSSVLMGGTSVLCGRYMGRGEMQKTQGVFSLNLTVSLGIGALITAVCLLLPGRVADLLGSGDALRAPLAAYIRGYAIGIIPKLLVEQLAAFLQLERRSALGYAGIAAMLLSNAVLDVLFVAAFHMDVWGLALATSLANWLYFLILLPHFFSKKAQLHYSPASILWRELAGMLKIGLPGALLVFCLSVRGLIINRILLTHAGQDGLSAMSAFNMVCGLFIALCLGIGAVVRMLSSIFIGEEDRDCIRRIIFIALTRGLALCAAVGAAVFALSGAITGLFFSDPGANVFLLTRQVICIYACCIPLVLLCSVSTNYLQALGHNGYVALQSVFDGLLSMVIPAAILAPRMGALGVWISNPIGILLTVLLVPAYALICWKGLPRTVDAWLFLREDFGVPEEDRLSLSIRSGEEVARTAVQVQAFCRAHGTAPRTAYLSALSLEEMAGNIVRHGFSRGSRACSIDCRVVYTRQGILLRIQDDCPPFNPKEWMEMASPRDPYSNIGIRMIHRLAQDVNYQNLLGVNVLTILLADENKEDTTHDPA